MSNKLFFRTEGNSTIGLGHVMRCIALSHIVEPELEPCFIVQENNTAVKQLLHDNQRNMIGIGAIHTDEPVWLKQQLTTNDMLVLDGYGFDHAYQQAVHDHVKALISVDDIHAYPFASDVVINHGTDIVPADYELMPGTQLFLGPRYAMLRSAFYDAAKAKKERSINRNVLVILGGSDPKGISFELLQHNAHEHCDELHIVLGVTNPQSSRIKELIESQRITNIFLHHNVNAQELIALAEQCSIAVCSASGVLYELSSVGTGLIACKVVDNQDHFYAYFTREGLALGVDLEQKDAVTAILAHIQTLHASPALIHEQVAKQRAVFDGSSGERVKAIFTQLDEHLRHRS